MTEPVNISEAAYSKPRAADDFDVIRSRIQELKQNGPQPEPATGAAPPNVPREEWGNCESCQTARIKCSNNCWAY